MIIKIHPDIQKSRSLRKMAEVTIERLEKTDKEKYPTNTLTDCYDIIHKLMEALSLAKGIKTSGEGAHQELIEHISREYHFDESERQLMQQIREYRNRISYEGFMIREEYILVNQEKIKRIIAKIFVELDRNKILVNER